MPYKNPKHHVRYQRQQRRTGKVRRIEVVLSADIPEDRDIDDYLNSLPRGDMSDFIRAAILEKIERDSAPPDPAPAQPAPVAASEQIEQLFAELADEKRRAGQQMEAMIAEVAALRSELREQQRQPVSAATTAHQAQPGTPPPTLPESGDMVQSSGIDMSRPRPRPAARTAPAAAAPPDEPLSEQESIRLAKILANSVKRAQPGRG